MTAVSEGSIASPCQDVIDLLEVRKPERHFAACDVVNPNDPSRVAAELKAALIGYIAERTGYRAETASR